MNHVALPEKIGIGALSRATGVPVETIRTWERRYAFPPHERSSAGHRLYDVAVVEQILEAKAELERGVRPGAVFVQIARFPSDPEGWLALVRSGGLRSALASARRSLGPLALAREVAAPLAERIGAAWAAGELGIAEEHVATGHLREALAECWRAAEGDGPLGVVAGLPGDRHELGLHFAASALAEAGWRVLFLGPDTPVAEIARVARIHGAAGVFVSVSAAGSPAGLAELAASLPGIPLVAGGRGAREAEGVVIEQDLGEFSRWARSRHP